MDGIGWIPVDFTPGFYYNTYALLRMAELAWGIVLAFLFALEVLFAVLELFRWRYEQKIRGPLPEEAEMAAGFLACAIAQNLRVCGINLQPGWNTEQTENEIRSTFQLGPRQRIALRYIGVLHGKDTLRHSNQI